MDESKKVKKYQYQHVKTTEDFQEDRTWKPFLRQLMVCSGALSIYLSIGVCYGAPTIFIQQLRQEANSTDAVSVEMASWLSSAFGFASLPWVFILSAISHVYGRRKTFILVSINTILMFIWFYLSETTTDLLIATILQGMPLATGLTVSILILVEFTSPKYRGIFLTMKVASVFWGIWFSNAIGTFFHWKFIPVFGLVCSLYSLTAFLWPESPFWLASKGKTEECKKSHRWLKGTGLKAEQELEQLLNGPTEIIMFGSWRQIKKKQFYKPTIISCLLLMQYYSSGKLVCSIYSIDILKKVTSSDRAAYTGMLILDGATVFSMYIGSFLNGIIRRRVQLFSTSSIGIFFLFSLSLYLYLIKLEILLEYHEVTLTLLIGFSIAMSCGPAIMSVSTFGEIIPQKYKNFCTVFVAVWFQVLFSIILKIFPYIYMAFGLHGTFFFYGICMSIFTVILYKLLPELKDKTLQEIEEYFK